MFKQPMKDNKNPDAEKYGGMTPDEDTPTEEELAELISETDEENGKRQR